MKNSKEKKMYKCVNTVYECDLHRNKKKKKACKLQKDEENCMGYTGALNIHYKGWSCSYF